MSTKPMALPSGPGALASIARFADVGLAFGVVGVIVVLVLPIPSAMLDMLLCMQLALSLAILVGTLYCNEALEFSGFPPMLLFITLFRLSLNVASARLILLNGDAGKVIHAFGDFVVGGNYIVGFAIFLILVAIQFVVITKGAGRVSEVAARFTLDAMPGKQMAIDADLNAGLIDESQARQRRNKIEREASFFGSMDGASKFVRGDAIAALLITAINILGGLAIGMLQKDMALTDALKRYTLLTIGDGLVTQIPALLVSTASGILVTRGASELNLGSDLSRQFLLKARPLQITATFLMIFALLPGMPTLPFASFSILLFVVAGMVSRAKGAEAEAQPAPVPGGKGAKGAAGGAKNERDPEGVEPLLKVEAVELEVGAALVPLAQDGGPGDLLARISQIRKRLASELGIVLPPVRVRDNLHLGSRKYRIRLRGAPAGEGELAPERLMAIDPGGARPGLQGNPARDPAFGLPAVWITPETRGRAEAFGYTVVDAASVLSTHIHEVLRTHAADLLSRQDVQNLVDRVKESDPAIVKDVVPNQIGLPMLHRVLQALLRERIPVRDMTTILETLGDTGGKPEPVESLIERVRVALSPSFVRGLEEPPGRLTAIALEPALESRMLKSLVMTEHGPTLVLSPFQVPRLLKAIEELCGAPNRKQTALLCSGNLRPHVRRLLERSLPKLPVLSYLEIPNGTQLEIGGQVRADVLGDEGGGLFNKPAQAQIPQPAVAGVK